MHFLTEGWPGCACSAPSIPPLAAAPATDGSTPSLMNRRSPVSKLRAYRQRPPRLPVLLDRAAIRQELAPIVTRILEGVG